MNGNHREHHDPLEDEARQLRLLPVLALLCVRDRLWHNVHEMRQSGNVVFRDGNHAGEGNRRLRIHHLSAPVRSAMLSCLTGRVNHRQ